MHTVCLGLAQPILVSSDEESVDNNNEAIPKENQPDASTETGYNAKLVEKIDTTSVNAIKAFVYVYFVYCVFSVFVILLFLCSSQEEEVSYLRLQSEDEMDKNVKNLLGTNDNESDHDSRSDSDQDNN